MMVTSDYPPDSASPELSDRSLAVAMNRYVALLLPLVFLALWIPGTISAQSREQGEALLREARGIQKNARTKKDFKIAMQKLREALGAFEATAYDNGIGEANLQLGRIHVNPLRQFSDAGECFQKSLEAFTRAGDVKGQAEALNGLGVVGWHTARHDEAVEYCEKALQMFRDLGDSQGEARTADNIAMIYEIQGHRNKAVEYLRNALQIFSKLGDRAGESKTLNNLGVAYRNLGRYMKAVECYERALEIKREVGDRRGEGYTLLGLAVVYGNWIDHSKSAQYAEEALSLFREIRDRGGEATALISLGMTYRDWGRYSTGVDYLEKALSITKQVGDRINESVALAALGLTHAHLDEFPEALANYRKSLALCKQTGIPMDFTLNRIANLYLTMGEIDKAAPFVMEAGYTATLGRYHLLKGEYEKAEGYYEKLSVSRHTGKERSEDNRYAAYTGLGMAYEGMGDYSQAADYYLKAVKHTEDLRSTIPEAQRHTFFQVRIEGFFRTAPYEGLSRVLVRMDRPLEAFRSSEFTKARVFAEALSRSSDSPASDIPSDLLRSDRELNDQRASLKKSLQVAYENESQEDIAELVPRVRGIEEALQAHIRMLRTQYPMFANTKYPQPIDLEQSALRDGEWLLTYDLTDAGLLVFLTRGKELKKALFKPVLRNNVGALLNKFREPLDIKSGERLTRERLAAFDFESGKKLSDLLLGGVLDHLPPAAAVTIVPDDSLGLLPFELLVLNGHGTVRTDGKIPCVVDCEFFGDRNPISYYQSVTALTLARTCGKPTARGGKLLVVADPVLLMTDSRLRHQDIRSKKTDHGLTTLYTNLLGAGAGSELSRRAALTGDLAKNLKRLYGPDAEVFTGLDASKAKFLGEIGPKLTDYRNVLLATHGYFGKDLPGPIEPVLLFTLVPPGTDGYLRMSEVLGLRMNAEMVALTACHTGVGNRVSGEGILGMGRAFQYAGARAVLMSLWAVSEKTSVMLVESFFRNLKGGKGKLEALTLARSEIRKAGFDHPFYWGPFILVGETR
jgi:tetratricopeptide (TPR) repeat protein